MQPLPKSKQRTILVIKLKKGENNTQKVFLWNNIKLSVVGRYK